MTAVVKVKANTVALSSASNVYRATYVYVVNTDAAEQTVTVANTAAAQNGGGDAGTLVLEAGASIVLRKQPSDTLSAIANVKATAVSRG